MLSKSGNLILASRVSLDFPISQISLFASGEMAVASEDGRLRLYKVDGNLGYEEDDEIEDEEFEVENTDRRQVIHSEKGFSPALLVADEERVQLVYFS
jgi:hypothetical protein